MGIATGFTIKKQEKLFLITNWHVVSGRNPTTKQLISEFGMEPSHLVAWFHVRYDQDKLTWEPRTCRLYREDGNPNWMQHPMHGSNVDVVALAIDNASDIRSFPINTIAQSDFRVSVSQDVFILGFPRGITGAGKFPIWKRGSIASEPSADLEGLPKCLVDTATREGMSGSPVIARYTGYYQNNLDKPSGEDWFGQGEQFFGIYSGRHIDQDELAAQLGIVWKARVIDEILADYS
jgi:hypothetical protein